MAPTTVVPLPPHGSNTTPFLFEYLPISAEIMSRFLLPQYRTGCKLSHLHRVSLEKPCCKLAGKALLRNRKPGLCVYPKTKRGSRLALWLKATGSVPYLVEFASELCGPRKAEIYG